MPQQRVNTFTAYIFTDEEMQEAVKLNSLQEMYYQSLGADTAEMLVSEKFDPAHAFIFAQREAYLRGQLDLLQFLGAQNANIKLAEETARRLKERETEDSQQLRDGA